MLKGQRMFVMESTAEEPVLESTTDGQLKCRWVTSKTSSCTLSPACCALCKLMQRGPQVCNGVLRRRRTRDAKRHARTLAGVMDNFDKDGQCAFSCVACHAYQKGKPTRFPQM
jgi:hypothetical protein